MQKYIKKINLKTALLICVSLAFIIGLIIYVNNENNKTRYTATTFLMSTIIDQQAYGKNAADAMQQVNEALASFEQEFSLFDESSDIAQINKNAGQQPVQVQERTFDLLMQAKSLSLQSEKAFALTIAPLTIEWGVTSDTPKVPKQEKIDELLALINDDDIVLDAQAETVMLRNSGQAIDLGGIAKGTACNVARDVYNANGVKSALLSIGGNVYAHGKKPDGSLYRIGFRDPSQDANTAIASVTIENEVFAVSGGYERFFEEDGVTYHHILDPKTGYPAKSDIVSVGVIHKDGTVADFYSTTLFVWGKERAIEYLKDIGTGMLLDNTGTLYVSKSLEGSFQIVEDGYTVVFI